MNYHNRKFRPVYVSEGGEVTEELIFHYHQSGNILTCTYQGKNIQLGHLLGKVDPDGNIDMRYHQIHMNQDLVTGICHSKPKIMGNGKIRLHETWQWTSGNQEKGNSILEEI